MIFSAKVKMVGKRDRSYADEETGKLKKKTLRQYIPNARTRKYVVHSLYVVSGDVSQYVRRGQRIYY